MTSNQATTGRGLLAAAAVLDDQAAGREPLRSDAITGALALDALRSKGVTDRELLDAAEGLRRIATGQGLDLDATGRIRAAHLAQAVRAAAAEH